MSESGVSRQEMMLDLIGFIAENGAEFVAKRVACDDEECELEHVCKTQQDDGSRCGKDSVWLVLLPSDNGLLDIELCAEHTALLLLIAEEGMQESDD